MLYSPSAPSAYTSKELWNVTRANGSCQSIQNMQTLKLEDHVQVRLEIVIMYYGNNLKIYKMAC